MMDIVKYLRANQEGWHDPDIVWVQVGAARVKEAADEIERLRKENVTLLHSADDVYKRLMPEVERLRETLLTIVGLDVEDFDISDAAIIARSALQQKESE